MSSRISSASKVDYGKVDIDQVSLRAWKCHFCNKLLVIMPYATETFYETVTGKNISVNFCSYNCYIKAILENAKTLSAEDDDLD